AQPALEIQAVDLVYHAVDIVIERGAALLRIDIGGKQLLRRGAEFHQRVDGKAPAPERLDDAELRVRRQGRSLAPSVGEKFERAARCNVWIELAQRSRRGIARVREHLAARR